MRLLGKRVRILSYVAIPSPLVFWLVGKAIRLASGCPLAATAECYTPAANAAAAEGLSLLCLFTVAPLAMLAIAVDHLAWRRWGA